jgi:pre-mRNA-splicing factor SPF27
MSLALDPPVSDSTRAHLEALITAERPTDYREILHPLVSTTYTPNFPTSLVAEHDRLASNLPKPDDSGVDLTRYEASALEPPPRTFPTSDTSNPEFLAAWRSSLNRAYTSSTYLTGRNANLALLETYGKNAWLVGNWNAEGELKRLEAEARDARTQLEMLERERTSRQEEARAEMEILEQTWRKAAGGMVEVQVATDELRQRVLEERSKGGQ